MINCVLFKLVCFSSLLGNFWSLVLFLRIEWLAGRLGNRKCLAISWYPVSTHQYNSVNNPRFFFPVYILDSYLILRRE